jgi:hypothetical protein
MMEAFQAVSEERWLNRAAVAGSVAYAEVQAEGDGSGVAAIVKHRATWEVAAVGCTDD